MHLFPLEKRFEQRALVRSFPGHFGCWVQKHTHTHTRPKGPMITQTPNLESTEYAVVPLAHLGYAITACLIYKSLL